LFVIVDAEDGSFWFHSLFPKWRTGQTARRRRSENFLDRDFRAR
jgi:hypothetical protein